MTERNLLCSEVNCGKPVAAFGFSYAGTKIYVCGAHLSILLEKHSTIYNLQKAGFIESPEDEPLYDLRTAKTHQGLAAISSLEYILTRDLDDSEQLLAQREDALLQTIRDAFSHIRTQLNSRAEEIRRALQEFKESLERFQREKEYELSPVESQLCEMTFDIRMFRLAAEDCSETVKALMQSCHCVVPQEAQGLTVLTQREETAKALLKFASEAKDIGRLGVAEAVREYAVSLSDFSSAVSAHMTTGSAARLSGDFHTATRELTQAHALAQSAHQEDPKLCLELGLSLTYFVEQRPAAISVLMHGLNLLNLESLPLAGLQIGNALALSYHQSGLWEETLKVCKWLTELYRVAPHAAEILITHFLAADSAIYMEKYNQTGSIVEAWARDTRVQGNGIHWIKAFVQEDMSKRGENQVVEYTEGEVQLNKYVEAGVLRWKALIHKAKQQHMEAEACSLQAAQLYALHNPATLDRAVCLTSLGVLYEDMKRNQSAKEQYLEAKALFEAHFRDSSAYAACLSVLGQLLTAMSAPTSEIQQCYEQACAVYSALQSTSLTYANTLGNLGYLHCKHLGGLRTAEDFMNKACAIYAQQGSTSPNYAICLYNLATFAEKDGRKQQGIQRCQEALQVYEARKEKDKVEKCRQMLGRLNKL